MSRNHYDYIVIGGGSGGYAAARTARETREHVAIVDGSEILGGLCILNGCMPSKTLIYSAELLHLAKKGKHFGLQIPQVTADMPTLNQRKINTITEFAEYRQEQLNSDKFTLFRNHAKFIDSKTIELNDGLRLTADNFMIATGSVVSTPPILGLNNVPFWTSDDVLDLNFLPKKVIVLGGGIVACELAQFLQRIGSEVIVIQRSPHILKEMSTEASTTVETAFRDEGIQLYTDTTLKEISHQDNRFTVTFVHNGQDILIEAPHLLNALGRRPATQGLNLKAAGVTTHKTGHIKCDETQRTINPRIYACGDVAGPHEIVHVAIMQGEAAAKHATNRKATPIHYDDLVSVVFTDPQVACVGLNDTTLKARSVEYISAEYPFDDHGKSIVMGAKYGYVKVFAEKKTGIIVGAECVSKDAGELIHSMAVAVTMKVSVQDLLKVHWYHPTLSEIWSYPVEDIVEEMLNYSGN